MDKIKLYTWLVFLLILASPFILQPWIEARDHRSLLIEKHGRLVDVRTSAPLANAIVIFHWQQHRRGIDCPLQRATTTDASGSFTLPDVSSEVSFHRSWLEAVLGTITLLGYYRSSYDYTLSIYAPGFALVAPWQASSNPPGLTYMLTNPPAKEVQGTMELDPIRVTRTSFTPADEISYLARLEDTLRCEWQGQTEPSEVSKVRDEIVARIRALPCSMPPASIMSAQVMTDYLWGLHDEKVMEALRPPGERIGVADWHRDLSAETVCRAASGRADQ